MTQELDAAKSVGDLRLGDHVCWLVESEEEPQAVLVPFVRAGLDRRERVICTADAPTAEAVLETLRAEGADVGACLERGQLEFRSLDQLVERFGLCYPGEIAALIRQGAKQALADGYSGQRAAIDARYSRHVVPSMGYHADYEEKLDECCARGGSLLLCRYDWREFDPEVVRDALLSHPWVVVGGKAYRNLYYLPPARLRSEDVQEVKLRHWIQVLAERSELEAELRKREERLRAQYEAIPLPTYTWRRVGDDFVLVDHNAAALEATDGRIGELVGITGREMWRDEPEVLAYLFRCCEERRTFEHEKLHRYRTTGRERLLRARYVFVPPDSVMVLTEDATEQRAAEAALRQSEGRFRGLVQHSLDVIVLLDTEGTIRYYSPGATSVLGYTPSELIDRNVFEFIHPDDVPRLMEAFAAVMQDAGATRTLEVRTRHKDGSWRILESTGSNLLDVPGVEGVVTNSRDVTLLRRAEAALRESEARYRAVSELTSDFAYAVRVEPDGTLVPEWVTEAHLRITGYSAEEMMALGRWEILVHPDDMPLAIRHLQIHLAGRPDVAEYRIITKAGETRWVRDHGRPIWDADEGRVVRVYGAVQDITAQKEMEKDLRLSEARYRAVSELTSDFAFSVRIEPQGEIVVEWVTEAFMRLSGFAPEEVGEPESFWRVVHPDDRDLVREGIQALLRGETQEADVRIVTRGGDVCWLHAHARPEWDVHQARVTHIYGAGDDVTEQRQMQQYALRAERLAAVGRLAAALAHEINNPLQAVSSNLDLALDFPLDQRERRKHLEIVRQEIDRLTSIARHALDFARPPDGERSLILVPHVVRYAVDMTRKLLSENGVEVRVDLPDTLPAVLASRDQLVQVFVNLISNAGEMMPDGGRLEVTAEQVDGQIRLTFADSGPGIAPETLGQVFQPFVTTKEDGTGMGLPIALDIVEAHGGTIAADNRPGGGAVFTVTLPPAYADEDSQEV